jgi:hypothetical protein
MVRLYIDSHMRHANYGVPPSFSEENVAHGWDAINEVMDGLHSMVQNLHEHLDPRTSAIHPDVKHVDEPTIDDLRAVQEQRSMLNRPPNPGYIDRMTAGVYRPNAVLPLGAAAAGAAASGKRRKKGKGSAVQE